MVLEAANRGFLHARLSEIARGGVIHFVIIGNDVVSVHGAAKIVNDPHEDLDGFHPRSC